MGGEQTHDGLDDCHDLKEVISKVAEDENRGIASVIAGVAGVAGDEGKK